MTERGMPVACGPKEAHWGDLVGDQQGGDRRWGTPGTTSHKARACGISTVVDPSAEAELPPIIRTELSPTSTLPEVRHDPKPRGKEEEKTGQGQDLRALKGRVAVNGNVFDESAEDHFSVIGSSDESEPEHGLTDDSDTDDGDDKRDQGGRFNFEDLDDAELDDNESESDKPREVAMFECGRSQKGSPSEACEQCAGFSCHRAPCLCSAGGRSCERGLWG